MIYHESHGEGPAIVFAHGVAGNHASWFQQVPVFSRSYRVVTFDHRGFGRSDDAEQLGRAGFVDDLKGLLDELGIDKACLVGQSMGGGTVVGFAGRYPERVSALVVSDSLFGIELPESIRAGFAEARDKAAGLGQLDRVLGKSFCAAEPAKTYLYLALAGFNATDRDSLPGSWGRLYTPDELKKLGVPILFAVGEHDVLVPPKLVHELSALIPGSFAVELSDAGHSPYFEKPTEFNDSVLSFLQAVGIKGADAKKSLSNTPGYTKVTD